MNSFKMEFLPIIDDIPHNIDIEEFLWDYLSCLYKNGQIMNDYSLYKIENKYISIMTLSEDNSLNDAYNNEYVTKLKSQLEQYFKISLEYFGNNINYNDICTCETSSWYMMYTDYYTYESPIACGDCGKEIPLHKIPYYQEEKEHYTLLGWQRAYQSLDKLYIYSLNDRFTLRNLNNPKGTLFKIGMDIRKDLELKLHKPVYYYVFYPNEEIKRYHSRCPICNKVWEKSLNPDVVEYICKDCRLATDISSEKV